jgi:hypothetical protein
MGTWEARVPFICTTQYMKNSNDHNRIRFCRIKLIKLNFIFD